MEMRRDSFLLSLIQPVLTKHLLCAKHCTSSENTALKKINKIHSGGLDSNGGEESNSGGGGT